MIQEVVRDDEGMRDTNSHGCFMPFFFFLFSLIETPIHKRWTSSDKMRHMGWERRERLFKSIT